MGSENEDRCFPSLSESDETTQQIYKQTKLSYTRDFLISLAELDTCKNLPSGFDPLILREFDDASNNILERPRIPVSTSSHSFNGSEYGSSQSNRYSDGRHYGDQYQRSWQNPEHDGLLGSGAFPRVSRFIAGASTPGVRGNGHHLLNRSNEPYRPPRPYKAVPHSGRENHDSYNDETFGSAECLSQEREEEERKRKASFELMRKEQHNAIHVKQKQFVGEHEENLDPDISTLLKDPRIDKRLVNGSNESEESVASPASNNKSAQNSFSTQILASRPLVPPGFSSKTMEKNPGTNPPVPEVENVDFEANLTCSISNPVDKIFCDSREEEQSQKDINDQQHDRKRIHVPYIDEGEKIVIPSSDADISDNIAEFHNPLYRASNFPKVSVAEEVEVTDVEDVTGDKIMDMSAQDHSPLVLEKFFGSASVVNSSDSFSFIENHDVKAVYTKKPISYSSKFAHWFLEEGKIPAGHTSSGNEKSGSQMFGVSDERVTQQNPPDFSSEINELTHKPMTSTSTSATDGISEQLYSCNKSTVTSVLTCEDLEQSILSKINENSSAQLQSVQGGSDYNTKDEQSNSANGDGLSQHLLSLLQKGANLKDLTASSKLNMELSDKLQLPEVQNDRSALNNSSKGDTENSERNLTLKPTSGTGVTKELQSTEASFSIQRGSLVRVARNDVLEPCVFPFPVTDNSFFPSTVNDYGFIGGNCEGIMASNRAKQTGLGKIEENHSRFDNAWANTGSNLQNEQGSKVSPNSGFSEKADSTIEICLPEEDSLITIDDPIMPQYSMFMPTGDQIHADWSNSTAPVNIAEKLAALKAALRDERSTLPSLKGRPLPSGSYDVMGSEPPYLNLHEQLSYPQFHHNKMNPGRSFFHTLDSPQAQLRKAMNPKAYHHNPPPHHHIPRNVPSSPFQGTHAEQTRFDHPIHHSLFQQMHMADNSSPHLVNRQPRGAPLPQPINQMACYTQELNSMQSVSRNYQQPSYGGRGMTNLDPSGIGRDKNQVAFHRLIEMELREKQTQRFPVAGYSQGTFPNESTWEFGMDNRPTWQ
ncbi:hypothetical protein L1049_020144 [Liquidambar formosana]|uniref:Uncharacterized protein n=1 Tax=Liquidambar formosana TaxID=63359 RepID=A0AAP0SAW7_LIQFO